MRRKKVKSSGGNKPLHLVLLILASIVVPVVLSYFGYSLNASVISGGLIFAGGAFIFVSSEDAGKNPLPFLGILTGSIVAVGLVGGVTSIQKPTPETKTINGHEYITMGSYIDPKMKHAEFCPASHEEGDEMSPKTITIQGHDYIQFSDGQIQHSAGCTSPAHNFDNSSNKDVNIDIDHQGSDDGLNIDEDE